MGKPPWLELCTVYVSKNQLKGLPHDFFKLTNLTDLRLDNNMMTNLPVTVSQLTRLHSIWLHNNELGTIPPEVSHLHELSFLSLNDNKIRCGCPRLCLERLFDRVCCILCSVVIWQSMQDSLHPK
jgi:Leucine-rich repeat (LRR) protein